MTLVVTPEDVDPHGTALSLPILNEENNQTETVALWGIRVPESVYRAVEADKEGRGPTAREVFAANGDARNNVVA